MKFQSFLELERPPSVLSNKKAIVTNQISTADVDPEFVENYRAESVDVPESPKHHLPTSQVITLICLPTLQTPIRFYCTYISKYVTI